MGLTRKTRPTQHFTHKMREKKTRMKKKKIEIKKYFCIKCGTEEFIPESEWAVSFTGLYCPRCKRRKMKEVLDANNK